MTQWTDGEIDSGGIPIHYYRSGGPKPPVICCHGITDNGLCWQRLARALEPDFDLILLDARNHGRSGSGDATLEVMADDVLAVIESLGLVQPAAIGHSMGAAVVAELAARQPHRLNRIVLEDPPWRETAESADDTARGQKALAEFARWIDSLADLSSDEIIDYARSQNPGWHEDDLPAWAQSKQQVVLSAMQRLDLGGWRETVAAISVPALLVHGEPELGGIVTAQLADSVRRQNDHFSVAMMEGAGHNVRRERFERYLAEVNGFLKAAE